MIRFFIFWIAPSTVRFDALRILALSTAIMLFFLYFGVIGLVTGARGYQTWAEALVSGASLFGNQALQWRDVGYALVLLAGHYPTSQSYIGVIILQALMAIAIPVMAYFTLHPWFPRAAFYTAVISTLSLAPFLMFKQIHHDQAYIFFMMLSVLLLNRFISTNRPASLYGFTLAMFAMSLMRLLGKYVFPILLLVALLYHPRRYKACILSAVVFIIGLWGYSQYRDKALGTPPSVLGRQLFHNIYLNAGDYGVRLSPDLGPNMRKVTDGLREMLRPSPAQSPIVQKFATDPDFRRDHIDRYSSDELFEKILTQPNLEYYYLLTEVASTDDFVLVRASLEIALGNPLYVLRFALRNARLMLYDPGWGHGRYTASSFQRQGNPFPLSTGQGWGIGNNVGDTAPEPALSEARYLPLAGQAGLIKDFYYLLDRFWRYPYHPIARILFVLMMVTWFSCALGLAGRVFRSTKLVRWSRRLSADAALAATGGISVMLLVNVGLTSLLVDPIIRYDYSLLMLKYMLAGVGAAILPGLFKPLNNATHAPASQSTSAQVVGVAPLAVHNHIVERRLTGIICAALIFGIGGWAWQMRDLGLSKPVDGTINVTSATIGGNCGVGRDNLLQHVQSACSGRQQCSFVFDWRDIANPAPNCTKHVQVEWRCTSKGPLQPRLWQEEPTHRRVLHLACE